MKSDEPILDRLELRRAAISQMSGEQPASLDNLVAEWRQKMKERRDQIISSLAERQNGLNNSG